MLQKILAYVQKPIRPRQCAYIEGFFSRMFYTDKSRYDRKHVGGGTGEGKTG